MIDVRKAEGAADLDRVRGLMRQYAAYLAENPAGAVRICLSDYEEELAALPGLYIAPGSLLLATVDGQPAGCVALKAVQVFARAEEQALEMKRLWVGTAFRGLGLGRTLVRAALDHAVRAGAKAIYLDTVPGAMPEANRLYREFGFERVARYNDNPVEDVVFFRLDLARINENSLDGAGSLANNLSNVE